MDRIFPRGISRAAHWVALLAAGLPLFSRAADAVPDAPPEWIQVHAPNIEGRTDRPLRYRPEGTDFVIENGAEFFNRPLYCINSAFRIDGGDQPEFSLYVPGRGGNLRFGLRTEEGVKWLNRAESVITRYRAGSLIYTIRDHLLGAGMMELTVLPLGTAKGLVARVEARGLTGPAELTWAFGGASGERGARAGDIGCERVPVSEFFQLAPEQCRGNVFTIASNTFTLRSRIVTLAGLTPPGSKLGIADATRWDFPAELLATFAPNRELPVLAGIAPLHSGQPLYLVLQQVGSNSPAGALELTAENAPAIFAAAEGRRQAIAERVMVETPDPFINAAAAALNIAGDAIWDQPADGAQAAFMHGAVAWRSKLLGWRGPYTADALGWHDRAEQHLNYWAGRQNISAIPATLPPADANANLARSEAALHSNGALSNAHYDMNLVYIDAFFRHLLWTGDLEFARREWPVVQRHLAWERRLFRRPFGGGQEPLYEAYAAIWASDNMQYNGGGAAHTTAFNYYHNKMAARVARLLRQDPAPYETEAALIEKAMQKHLWLADRGWYAEWKDYLGLQLAHPNAGLWTFYHTLDSEVPDPFAAWQMTRFVDTQIARLPLRGPGVPKGDYYTLPSSSWMPYIWSLNNVVVAEVMHTSLAYWQAGRPEAAFPVFKGCLLDTMYMGLCPGNVGMATSFDVARREAQRDFGDAIGITSRTMIEGLFGVHPDLLAEEVRVQPGFPGEWEKASLRHPDFDFSFQREGLTETYVFDSRFNKPVKLQLAAVAWRDGVASLRVNGHTVKWSALAETVGAPRLDIRCPAAVRHEVVIVWKGSVPGAAKPPFIAAQNSELHELFPGAKLREVTDPQHVLEKISRDADGFRARVTGTPGHHTVFVKLQQEDLAWWSPVAFEVRPAYEIIAAKTQTGNTLRFRVRNNTFEEVYRQVEIRTPGGSSWFRLRASAFGDSSEIVLPVQENLPGTIPVTVDLGAGNVVRGDIVNWKIHVPSSAGKFEPVPLDNLFNDRVTQIFRHQYLSPRSPFCSLALPTQGLGGWAENKASFDVNDAGFRMVASQAGGEFILPAGLPFRTPVPAGDKNILFTSQWDNFPAEASVPLQGAASHAYLLMAGSSNPMESQFDNGEVIVTYADGSTGRLALKNPVNWWPIDQDYFIDDFAFRRPDPVPPRVDLRSGQVRVLDAADFKGQGAKVPGGAATVLDLALDPAKELKSLTVRTLANEVVVGLMAVTLAR